MVASVYSPALDLRFINHLFKITERNIQERAQITTSKMKSISDSVILATPSVHFSLTAPQTACSRTADHFSGAIST